MAEIVDKLGEVEKKVGNLATVVTKRGVFGEFKEFINRGNVVDVSVAFVMGAAFKTVVDSFAGSATQSGVLGGFIGAIFGGRQPDFSKKYVTIHGSQIPFGTFATASLNFFFVALALFLVVKVYNRFRNKDDAPKGPTTEQLLAEIRDELRLARGQGSDTAH